MTTTLVATTSRYVMLLLAVGCRQCNAPRGDVCRSVHGNVTPFPHMKRLDDAGVPIELLSKNDAYLAAATAVVLGRVPTPDELELAHQRGLAETLPWVRKAKAGLDVNTRIDRQHTARSFSPSDMDLFRKALGDDDASR